MLDRRKVSVRMDGNCESDGFPWNPLAAVSSREVELPVVSVRPAFDRNYKLPTIWGLGAALLKNQRIILHSQLARGDFDPVFVASGHGSTCVVRGPPSASPLNLTCHFSETCTVL